MRFTVDDGVRDLPVKGNRVTIGGAGSGEHLDVDLGQDLPPGRQIELTFDDERILLRVVGKRPVCVGARVVALGRTALVRPEVPVVLDMVTLTVHDRRPGLPLRPRHLGLAAALVLTITAGVMITQRRPVHAMTPTDALLAAFEARGRADDVAADKIYRAVLAEERGDCPAARALYREGWLATTLDDPLQLVAEDGVMRCPPPMEQLP